jgi:hypothetical protein
VFDAFKQRECLGLKTTHIHVIVYANILFLTPNTTLSKWKLSNFKQVLGTPGSFAQCGNNNIMLLLTDF